MKSVNYDELIHQIKQGNCDAYNVLCTEFLEYVPLLAKDLSVLFKHANLEIEDIHQEGYLAICESIQMLSGSKVEYSAEDISSIIVSNIIKHITDLVSVEVSIEDHEIDTVFKYDDFHKFLCAMHDSPTRNAYIRMVSLI